MSSSEASPAAAAQDADSDRDSSAPPVPTTEASPNGELPADDDDEIEHDDLFGSDDDDEAPSKLLGERRLSDSELDSADDEDRHDREVAEGYETEATQQFNFMDMELTRHFIPESSDNELYLLKIPHFLTVEPTVWHHTKFQPPTTDHHSKVGPSTSFSPYNTAMTTVRWRHSPSNPEELQSNARILRWSDGSLTLQLASDPTVQYEIDAKPLAPPQVNPPRPTPTSITNKGLSNGAAPKRNPNDQSNVETFTFLTAPVESAGVMRITNKLTTSLSVLASSDSTDDALERLTASLSAAAKRNRGTDTVAVAIAAAAAAKVTEDPELARKQAEAAEKEKARAARKREVQEQRERERNNRVLAPRGLGYDDEGGSAVSGRKRGAAGSAARRSRRGDIYSDEEDEGMGRRGGRTAEDDYDEEDDFIAKSDDEEEDAAGEEDDEEEEAEDELDAMEANISKERAREKERKGSPKRDRREVEEEDGDGEEDAEGEADEEEMANVGRSKRRRVVDDDDDDEDE